MELSIHNLDIAHAVRGKKKVGKVQNHLSLLPQERQWEKPDNDLPV